MKSPTNVRQIPVGGQTAYKSKKICFVCKLIFSTSNSQKLLIGCLLIHKDTYTYALSCKFFQLLDTSHKYISLRAK